MSSRIWWRLADVWPLAEHAMSTPTANAPHNMLPALPRGITIQTGAPALIWQLDEEGDELLSSNGFPAWHDCDGGKHAACALIWRHPASATSGTYDHANPEHDYIKINVLRRDRRIHPFIDTIRKGIKQRHHWFVIDTSTWPFTCSTSDHRDDIVPADAQWTQANVTAAAVDHAEYPAVIAEGYLVADGVLPRFTRQTAEQIALDLEELNGHPALMPGEHPLLRFDGDIAVISWQEHSRFDERLREIDRCYPDADGLYAIGAYQWTWRQAE